MDWIEDTGEMEVRDEDATRLERTCAVVVNFQTPDLLKAAVRSFKSFYPRVPLVIVDNGSRDSSRLMVESLCSEYERVTCEYKKSNMGHGPAMHGVIARAEYEFYFFLDSDTITREGGFLEEMLDEFADPEVYGVGQVVPMNKRGFYDPKGAPALVAAYMLIREPIYRTLSPFEHHGAPVRKNFMEASRRNLKLKDYPIQTYIDHLHRGTASRFGYKLGLKGKINHLLNKLGI